MYNMRDNLKRILFILLLLVIGNPLALAVGSKGLDNTSGFSYVEKVEINDVKEPVPKESISNVYTIPKDANYMVSSLTWNLDGVVLSNEDVYEEGKEYELVIEVKPLELYAFKFDVKGFINDEEVDTELKDIITITGDEDKEERDDNEEVNATSIILKKTFSTGSNEDDDENNVTKRKITIHSDGYKNGLFKYENGNLTVKVNNKQFKGRIYKNSFEVENGSKLLIEIESKKGYKPILEINSKKEDVSSKELVVTKDLDIKVTFNKVKNKLNIWVILIPIILIILLIIIYTMFKNRKDGMDSNNNNKNKTDKNEKEVYYE